MTTHSDLIRDTADLGDAVLEPLTTASMAAMTSLLDQIEVRLATASATFSPAA